MTQWESRFEGKRYEYQLTPSSVVLDVGGYHGEFVNGIYSKYQCNVHCFEPVWQYYDILTNKYGDTPKIKIYKKGLADKTSEETIYVNGDATSTHIKVSDNTQIIKLQSIKEFLDEAGITDVDLIKINIEGGEYPLLEFMIANNIINKFKDIQVQFHNTLPGFRERMDNIKADLTKTHSPTYQYFDGDNPIWENWRRNG